MTIAVPASAAGGAAPLSILTLEPLLSFLRDVRPDAVSLLPPPGPDDQPNGAALIAVRERLEQEGFWTVGGTWRIPPDVPVEDAGWRVAAQFEVGALVAALGEAGISPLTLCWGPPPGGRRSRAALRRFLERLVEEAARAEVRIALCLEGLGRRQELGRTLAELDSPWVGASVTPWDEPVVMARRMGSRLWTIACPPDGPDTAVTEGEWVQLGRKLAGSDASVLLEGCHGPLQYAHAVGFLRGAMSRARQA